MNDYIATFHTHFAALSCKKKLTAAGVNVEAAPVPRALSSSCGVCLRYAAEKPLKEYMHRDFERIVISDDGTYVTVEENK